MNTPTAITLQTIRDRDSKRGNHVFPGQVAEGHKAEIVPGKSITLHGAVREGGRYVQDARTGKWVPNARPMLYANHFEVGDVATYGGYNLTYMGRIVSITAKTVSIIEEVGSSGKRIHRLSIARFDRMNWDFDQATEEKRNSEWMD